MKRPSTLTPARAGFRMPAEWEPQAAVWLSWPHNRATWPGRFRPIPYAYARFVAAISRYEDVRINAAARLQPRALRLCRAAGADMKRVRFFNHPTNDAWCRDHGPIFVKNDRTGEVAVQQYSFSGTVYIYIPLNSIHRLAGTGFCGKVYYYICVFYRCYHSSTVAYIGFYKFYFIFNRVIKLRICFVAMYLLG